MKVKMLVTTYFNGLKEEGKEYIVSDEVGMRWYSNGIAEPVEEEEVTYQDMSSKQLFNLCKERGIEVEPKKDKDYYIQKLEEQDAAVTA